MEDVGECVILVYVGDGQIGEFVTGDVVYFGEGGGVVGECGCCPYYVYAVWPCTGEYKSVSGMSNVFDIDFTLWKSGHRSKGGKRE